MKTCDIIGISDSQKQWFAPDVMDIIRGSHVFSGGRRHHEIVASLLPEGAVWIDITVPLDKVFRQYEDVEHVVIFASGDPLFYGFATTVQRECKGVAMRVFASPNSLQMLAHRMSLPYQDMHVVSLTGRPWEKFDEALIRGEQLIGCLTDRTKTPHAIHQRMEEYGYHYTMTVGEHLGNEEKERVSRYDGQAVYDHPNCVILQKASGHARPFGLPDSSFALLHGREKMITKMPIRLLTLQALDLPRRSVLWDIGACTGSVSIEARLLFPHLHVVAFEIRPECEDIILKNCRRHGAPGIELHIGDFLALTSPASCGSPASPLSGSSLPAPDAVFIGGHGGKLRDIMARATEALRPGGIIVMNSVTSPVVDRLTDHRPGSRQLFDEACAELGLRQAQPLRIVLDDYNPIEILQATKP